MKSTFRTPLHAYQDLCEHLHEFAMACEIGLLPAAEPAADKIIQSCKELLQGFMPGGQGLPDEEIREAPGFQRQPSRTSL